jgi:hypothetical protein
MASIEEQTDFLLQLDLFLESIDDFKTLPEIIAKIRIKTHIAKINGNQDYEDEVLFATVPNKDFPSPWTKMHNIKEETWSVVSNTSEGTFDVGSGFSEFVAAFLCSRANHQNWRISK